MTIGYRPMNRLKDFFQGVIATRKPPENQMAAVVYRRFRGSLTILALKDKKGVWSIPIDYLQPGETDEQAVKRIVAASSGLNPDDLKVWQSLGRFQIDATGDAKGDSPSCFLVQSLAGSENLRTEGKQPAAFWLTVEEVLERTDDDGMAEIVMLAVAKLKRAQI